MEKNELSKTIAQVLAEINAINIVSQAEYEQASAFLKKIKDTIKTVDDAFEDERVDAKAVYDTILENRRVFKKPLEQADEIVRNKMSVYATKMQALRDAELAVERERLRKEKEEQALRRAEELAAMGRNEAAEQALDKPVEMTKLDVLKAVDSGVVSAKVGKTIAVWNVCVSDMPRFLEAVLLDSSMLPFITIDSRAITAHMKAKGIKEYAGLKIEVVQRPVL